MKKLSSEATERKKKRNVEIILAKASKRVILQFRKTSVGACIILKENQSRSSCKGRKGNALASGADEGRDKLR